ncbi:MAG: alkaline phosphatase family protein [Candidatus Norongarragalinales archaeon]
MKVKKLLLLGLDGGTMSMVKRLGVFKYLPYQKEVMTTIPPLTFPAVPTMYTGKNPAELGFSEWIKPNGEPVSFSDITEPTIWDVLACSGVRCSVLNVPLTFPVRPIRNGRIAAGYPSPRVNTWPEMNWELDFVTPDHGKRPSDEYAFQQEIRISKQRLAYVDSSFEFNFVWIKGPDTLGHTAWGTRVYDEYYRFLDEEIEKKVNSGEFDETIIVSDHGYAAKPTHEFHINTWLEEKGWVKTSFKIKLAHKLASKFPVLKRLAVKQKIQPKSVYSESEVYSDRETGIWCPPDQVDEIVGELKKEKFVKAAWRREEVYHGKFIERFPPVVFVVKEDYVTQLHFADEVITPHKSAFRGDHHSSFEAIFLSQKPYEIENTEQLKDLVVGWFKE